MIKGSPAGDPESVGLSASRLAWVNETMKHHIGEGRIADAITLVARARPWTEWAWRRTS